jgi:hypothetical protein
MRSLLSSYIASTSLSSALIVSAIIIGVTVRVLLMVHPGSNLRPSWRQLFRQNASRVK